MQTTLQVCDECWSMNASDVLPTRVVKWLPRVHMQLHVLAHDLLHPAALCTLPGCACHIEVVLLMQGCMWQLSDFDCSTLAGEAELPFCVLHQWWTIMCCLLVGTRDTIVHVAVDMLFGLMQ